MVVFGTRPEAIKMAPVVRALQARAERFDAVTCVTAQHRDMLDQVLALLEVEADHDLDIMTHGQDLYDVTARVIVGMRDVLRREKPDAVLVHGDTTTSTIAGLAAFYEQIPVGHVEAGLRSHLRYSPFPEELNRRLTAQLATWHYAPTAKSRANLLAEGIEEADVVETGNTAIDALFWMKENLGDADVGGAFAPPRRGILVTAHRRENFGAGIENICLAIADLVAAHDDVEVVYPVHPNPNIKEPVHRLLGDVPRVRLIEPVDYREIVLLMSRAHLILTDSGGIQEEAPSLGKPVLVLRECTERPEAVDAGTVALVGTEREVIVETADRLLSDPAAWSAMARAVNPYGDGYAAPRIADHLAGVLTPTGSG
ncbi:MAG: UDP-N-acetylglucosamine 2-epimerase (non-hydrolyzing) [bacterium]|nr:UDP-N-acetylglucosamine 2-epimerase (non-hydrolyzing) [bacterium]